MDIAISMTEKVTPFSLIGKTGMKERSQVIQCGKMALGILPSDPGTFQACQKKSGP